MFWRSLKVLSKTLAPMVACLRTLESDSARLPAVVPSVKAMRDEVRRVLLPRETKAWRTAADAVIDTYWDAFMTDAHVRVLFWCGR